MFYSILSGYSYKFKCSLCLDCSNKDKDKEKVLIKDINLYYPLKIIKALTFKVIISRSYV